MSFKNLNKDNFILYAAKAYDRPNVIQSEFQEDMKRFNYLKRLFRRYSKYKEMRERLVLNHLVVLYNVFGVEPTTRMLFHEIRKKDWPVLKTFLVFLSYMPEKVKGIDNDDIISSDIQLDSPTVDLLRKIIK